MIKHLKRIAIGLQILAVVIIFSSCTNYNKIQFGSKSKKKEIETTTKLYPNQENQSVSNSIIHHQNKSSTDVDTNCQSNETIKDNESIQEISAPKHNHSVESSTLKPSSNSWTSSSQMETSKETSSKPIEPFSLLSIILVAIGLAISLLLIMSSKFMIGVILILAGTILALIGIKKYNASPDNFRPVSTTLASISILIGVIGLILGGIGIFIAFVAL